MIGVDNSLPAWEGAALFERTDLPHPDPPIPSVASATSPHKWGELGGREPETSPPFAGETERG